MSFAPKNTDANFLQASITPDPDPKGFSRQWNTVYRRIAQGVNDRELARYDCIDQGPGPIVPPGFERPTGQQWAGATNQVTRPAFRKVVVFPALVAGVNTQAHNLGPITTYTFVLMRCVLQNQAASSFAPLSNPCDDDCFDILGPNVRIILPGGSPWIGYTAQVVLEYLKN